MSYTPEPGTDWKDLDPAKLYNIVDAFKNEAVYAAGQELLGDAITDFATGLLVGGGTEFDAVRHLLFERLRAARLRRCRCLHGGRRRGTRRSTWHSRARIRRCWRGRRSTPGRPT